jgi:hypothetical protein
MPQDTPTTYARILAINNQGGCGCSDSHAAHPHTDPCKDCGCCPPGLVAVKDEAGNHIACLTPNDANLYMVNTYKCADGYVKYINAAGEFVGCVTPADLIELRNSETP